MEKKTKQNTSAHNFSAVSKQRMTIKTTNEKQKVKGGEWVEGKR